MDHEAHTRLMPLLMAVTGGLLLAVVALHSTAASIGFAVVIMAFWTLYAASSLRASRTSHRS